MVSPIVIQAPVRQRIIHQAAIVKQTADSPLFFRANMKREDRYVQTLLSKGDCIYHREQSQHENRRHPEI